MAQDKLTKICEPLLPHLQLGDPRLEKRALYLPLADDSSSKQSHVAEEAARSELASISQRNRDVLQVVLAPLLLAAAAVADVATNSLQSHSPIYTPLVGVQVSVLFTLRAVKVKALVLDMRTVPLLVCVLLLAIGVPLATVWKAMIGTPELCPLRVLIIFFGMAYICVSLDDTGLLRHIALQAALRTESQNSVFAAVAGLAGTLTLVTSNDIVVLTLTPIILHLCAAKGYDPYPFLYLQFVTANVWSITLLIGNPTNVIVADAANFNFSTYFRQMAATGLVSGAVSVVIIYVAFRSKLRLSPSPSPNISSHDFLPRVTDSRSDSRALRPCRGWLCAIRLVMLLVLANLDSLTHVPLWKSVAFFCGVSLAMDIAMDMADIDGLQTSCIDTLKNMPWAVAPFVLGLFFMVEVLDSAGCVSTLAKAASSVIGNNPVRACFGVGIASVLACQVLNNQPMTVLFTKVLIHPDFNVGQDARYLAMRALIVGSNLGANLTLIGALAGPMWAGILERKEIKMSNGSFTRTMARITPIVALAAFTTLLLT